MARAIEVARAAIAVGEPPFGALVLDPDDTVIVALADQVKAYRDLTRHAETEAIRAAVAVRGPDLSGCTLLTTVEPCPMCFTAAWLSKVGRIVYGTTMAAVAEATHNAQRELEVPVEQMNALSGDEIEVIGAVASHACLALFSAGAIPDVKASPAGRSR
jgi:tRNA(Arg) A34 adenosine deaminase TadA